SKQRAASSNPFALRSCSGCLVGDRGVDRTVRADLCDARGPHPCRTQGGRSDARATARGSVV
ncbi:uncharacterized protein METZ01_LOCUS487783, partial [marine metagenome]